MLIKKIKRNLTLFDILILFVVIISLAFLAYFFLRRTKHLEVTVKITDKSILYAFSNPPNWFSEYFQVGMIAKDGLGRKAAEVKKVFRYDVWPNAKAVYLTVDLKADYSKSSDKYSYEGKPLIVGSPIKIEFSRILVEGLITHIEGFDDVGENKEMLVETQIMWQNETFPETYGVPSYIPDNINIGDEVKDSRGNTVITIVDKKVEPAKKLVTDSRGNVFIRHDPLKKDVFLTLKLNVKEIHNEINDNEYYLFDDIRIMVGQDIRLLLPNLSVAPKIVKILSVN
ncbi:DUF4330 family protein [Patescibacteria group bacterium]